jgi:hypothetical protein
LPFSDLKVRSPFFSGFKKSFQVRTFKEALWEIYWFLSALSGLITRYAKNAFPMPVSILFLILLDIADIDIKANACNFL